MSFNFFFHVAQGGLEFAMHPRIGIGLLIFHHPSAGIPGKPGFMQGWRWNPGLCSGTPSMFNFLIPLLYFEVFEEVESRLPVWLLLGIFPRVMGCNWESWRFFGGQVLGE